MIYCVWYPSGGFGHFVNAVLTMYGHNFVRPSNTLTFSSTGDSHALALVVPKYQNNSWSTSFQFQPDQNYSVLIDNGINDEGEIFKSIFPHANVIKICYSDKTWPIVAKTMIVKAMQQNFDKAMQPTEWDSSEPWAQREKYFLYLRDHALRQSWKPNKNDHNLMIDYMLDYKKFFDFIHNIVAVDNFQHTWNLWQQANAKFIDPVKTADHVIDDIQSQKHSKLDHITDIWTQAVVYYYIWLNFEVEVPHNDFANFFSHTGEILELLS